MFTYRLHLEDGSDAGQATYSVLIKPGEEILVGNGRRFRVSEDSTGDSTPRAIRASTAQAIERAKSG